jgi:ABC-type transport system involved in cytochrome c biogenesis permease subunit
MDSSLLFNIATLAYLVAMVLYISFLAFKKDGIGLAATVVTYAGFIVQTIALFGRWWESYQMGSDIGRVPLSNLYESLVFFTWSTVLIYLIVEYKYKARAFGAFVMPVAFLALAFINVAGISSEITPLVPALKSNWLFYHVLISFLGYAAFAVAFAVSMVYLLMSTDERGKTSNLFSGIGALIILAVTGYFLTSLSAQWKTAFWLGIGVLVLAWFIYLIMNGANNKSQVYLFWAGCVTLAVVLLLAMGIDFVYLKIFENLASGESFKKHLFEGTFVSHSTPIVVLSWAATIGIFWFIWSQGMKLKTLLKSYMPNLDLLDDVTYRMIAIGWPLLTGGIVTGAVWANSAWEPTGAGTRKKPGRSSPGSFMQSICMHGMYAAGKGRRWR